VNVWYTMERGRSTRSWFLFWLQSLIMVQNYDSADSFLDMLVCATLQEQAQKELWPWVINNGDRIILILDSSLALIFSAMTGLHCPDSLKHNDPPSLPLCLNGFIAATVEIYTFGNPRCVCGNPLT
jgi:hypothetical protein